MESSVVYGYSISDPETPEEYTKITSPSNWYWYKTKLDVDRKIEHEHIGMPNGFPCIVVSHLETEGYCRDTYYHEFKYQKRITCQHCGKLTEIIWEDAS